MVLTRKNNGAQAAEKNDAGGFGLNGAEGEAIRAIFKAEDYSCYRLHVEDGEHMQDIREFIEDKNGGNVPLVKHDGLVRLAEQWSTNSDKGRGRALDTRIVVSAKDEEILALLDEQADPSHAVIKGVASNEKGEDVKFELWKDQLMGTKGTFVNALWGLEEVFAKGHYVGRSAVATAALIEEMKEQLGTDSFAPVALVRQKIGEIPGSQSRDIMGITMSISDDREGMTLMRKLTREFDWGKFAEKIGTTETVELVDKESYCASLAELRAKNPQVDNAQDKTVAQRTAMMFRIKEGVDREELRAKCNEVLHSLTYEGDDLIEDVHIGIGVKTNRPFARVICKDRFVFRDLQFATSCFRDVCGPQVRIIQGQDLAQRLAQQTPGQGQKGHAAQVWNQPDGADQTGDLILRIKNLVVERESFVLSEMKMWMAKRQQEFVKEVSKQIVKEIKSELQNFVNEIRLEAMGSDELMDLSQDMEQEENSGQTPATAIAKTKLSKRSGGNVEERVRKGAKGATENMDTDAGYAQLGRLLAPFAHQLAPGTLGQGTSAPNWM